MALNEIDALYFTTVADIQDATFDYIVLGGGAYGTSFTHRILALDPKARVLVLEKGPSLIPEHIQNLPPTYVQLNTEVGVRPWTYSGSDALNFMPQIPYVGGRALFWNAWVPQPDVTEMPDWPQEAIDALKPEWYHAGVYMGRRYSLATPGNVNASLAQAMRNRLFAALADIDTATPQGDPRGLDSAMATGQGVPPEEWAKFSPIPILVADAQAHSDRLKVAVEAEATRLICDSGAITAIETVSGTVQTRGARVVLACNTLEAGFLMSRSFPDNPLVGKNLCGHIRSWLALRTPAEGFPGLTDGLQAIALYLPGRDAQDPDGRLMHTHVSVVHNPHPEEAYDVLYRVLPDASSPQAVAAYQDPRYVVVMLHTMGEFLGERSADSWNWANTDAQGNAQVHVQLRADDQAFWSSMDRTTFQVAEALVGDAPVEYQHTLDDGSIDWKPIPPESIHNTGLVHSAGTLWMGDDPATSVTDPTGKVHGVANLYGVGGMCFPRPGSWNPTLTGVAQTFALARRLASTPTEES